jgi:uracil-DNA glycosylase family 4
MSFFTEHELVLACPPGCGTCGLHERCKSPRLSFRGEGKTGILLLDSAPHSEDDATKCRFQGSRAEPLIRMLKKRGYNIDRDFWQMSAVNCRVPDDRAPNETQLCACRSFVIQTIEQLQPRLIICLGPAATTCIMGHTAPTMSRGIDYCRGYIAPDQCLKTWVGFTYGLDYVEKTSFDPVVKVIWEHDITSMLSAVKVPFPVYSWQGKVEWSRDTKRILSFLKRVKDRKPCVALDYETTGLKPHAKGHKVVSVALAPSSEKAFAFVLDDADVFRAFASILEDEGIDKVAHNAPFELLWSDTRVVPIEGRVWDTCLLAHVADCRHGITALDTQAYFHFGIPSWDVVESYKTPVDKSRGANSLNQVARIPVDTLLEYNAVDALVCRWLYDYYREEGLIQC